MIYLIIVFEQTCQRDIEPLIISRSRRLSFAYPKETGTLEQDFHSYLPDIENAKRHDLKQQTIGVLINVHKKERGNEPIGLLSNLGCIYNQIS